MIRKLYSYKSKLTAFVLIIMLIAACGTDEKRKGELTDPESIYFDYQITGEEGNDNLTIMLRYRDGDKEGDAVSIREPGKVELDGETLIADSAKMTGTFYELHRPIDAFAGKHSIVFTSTDKKQYKEEFNFQPIVLLTALSDTIRRGDLVFEFEGLEPEDYLRVVLTDTSFNNNEINRLDTVINGKLSIPRSDLESLAPGPLHLEFIREYKRRVKNGTKQGGRLLIIYGLKRDIFLKD